MEIEQDPCEICDSDAQWRDKKDGTSLWNCPCCGKYIIAQGDLPHLGALKPADRPKVYGWIRERNRNGDTPNLTRDLLSTITVRAMPSITKRAESILLEAIHRQQILQPELDFSDKKFQAASYSTKSNDVYSLLAYLVKNDYVKIIHGTSGKVSIDGQIFAESLLTKPKISGNCFVAMWFDKQMLQPYKEGFSLGIMQAGYTPIRMDRVDHNNKMDDEIIAHIRASAFIVADFTGQRGGVYFEAGFAMGLGLPVVWTCRADDVKKLHFDIRQYNCVLWERPDELKFKLKNRIEATIGRGPLG